MEADLAKLSIEIGSVCQEKSLTIATAESCTGGWAAQVITHTPGSSAWFERGFVTYANVAKTDMLGVRMDTITNFGAVSLETANEMARGALSHSNAMISLAITGVAGPTGGTPEKPAGTVCFAWCIRNTEGIPVIASCERRLFSGDRESIRKQSVIFALSRLLDVAKSAGNCARNMP